MPYVSLLEATQIVHRETGVDITIPQMIRVGVVCNLPLCVLLDVKCYSPTHRIRREKKAQELDPDYWRKYRVGEINDDDVVYAYGLFVLPPRHVFAYQTKETVRIESVSSLDGEDIYFPFVEVSRDEIQITLHHLTAFMERIKTAASSQPVPADDKPIQQRAPEGINKNQVLDAFESLVRINLKKALGDGKGLFGDGGARTQKGTPGGRHAALWNPVILAIGLHEKYNVPMPHLKRAFLEHSFLSSWLDEWSEKLELLEL